MYLYNCALCIAFMSCRKIIAKNTIRYILPLLSQLNVIISLTIIIIAWNENSWTLNAAIIEKITTEYFSICLV